MRKADKIHSLFLPKFGGMSEIQPTLRNLDGIEARPLLAVNEQMAWGAEQGEDDKKIYN